MNPIDDILREYISMRGHGLEVNEVLRAIKIYVEPLNPDVRETLAKHIRTWESEQTKSKASPIRKIKPKVEDVPLPETGEFTWVECRNCGKKNRAKEVFCYSCGEMLQKVAGKFDTKHFGQAGEDVFHEEYYSDDSVLILEAKNAKGYYEIRPQQYDHDLVLGRKSSNPRADVDIDLEQAKGSALGVSRMHLGLAYDRNSNTLQLQDLNSANGTFINGQKVIAGERRALRHGDELRLGRLIFGVKFLHPGQEL